MLEHLRDRALAEIQSVVRACLDGNEFLEAINRAEDGIHTLIAGDGGHARIMRMAGQSDFVLVGNGDHAFQEIGDALPINISRDAPSTGEGRPRGRVAKSPSTVSGSASARSPAGPQDT